MHESERICEENRYAEQSRNYRLYLELIDQYLASEEGIANVSKTGDNMADNDKMQLTNKYFQLAYHHLSARMMFEVFALFVQKGLMFPDRVQLLIKMQGYRKFFSEKRVEQLKRAKARRLKEEQLKLENQIAEAEDAVELAKTKVQFYEELSLKIPLEVLLAEQIVYKT